MASAVAMPDGRTLRIRLYRPEDRDQVYRVFRQGMEGLTKVAVRQYYSNYPSMKLVSCAVPAAAFLLTPKRCSFAMKAAIGIGAIAATPLVVYGFMRHVLRSYVNESINDDLKNIETFYSVAGAGHGSAFWVAELVEAAPSTSSAETPAAAQRQEAAEPAVVEVVPVIQPASVQAPAAAPFQAPVPCTATFEAKAAAEADPVKSLVSRLIASAIAQEGATRPAVTAAPVATEEPASNTSASSLPAAAVAEETPASSAAPSATSSRWTLPVLASAATAAQVPASAPAPTSAPSTAPRQPVIIGHVALERKTWQVAELRRMSVAPAYRGMGIAGKMLDVLVQHARDNGFRELFLTTSSLQPPAQRVYERGGWTLEEVKTWQGMQLFKFTLDLIKKR